MNQMQQQPPQQQGGPQGGSQNNVNGAQMLAPNQVPAHLIGLMTNPSLAAAAAASPLFPPAAMLSNPGAFLHMPEAFAAGANRGQQQTGMNVSNQQAAPGGAILPRMGATGYDGAGNQLTSQSQQQQQQAMLAFAQAQQQSGSMQQPSQQQQHLQNQQLQFIPPNADMSSMGNNDDKKGNGGDEMTSEEKIVQNRDRNREHARSTRLRKKAYVQKLKELVEGLHAERSAEVRQRRIAISHLVSWGRYD